jgi:hypothetical protein
MNERIQELAEQAGITTNIDTDHFETDPNKWMDYYSVKFANLIIAECIAAVASNKTAIEKVGNFCDADSVWKTASLTQNNTDINAIEMRFGL